MILNRRYTSHTVGLGVVCEFGKSQPFCPIDLSVVHIDPQILLNLTIDLFGLSIHLWVIGGGQICLDVEKFIKIFHE